VMLDIPVTSYIAAPALFLAVLGTAMPRPPIRLDPISAMIYFMHVLALHLAHALGVQGLAGLMAFAVGLPALAALVLRRLPIRGFEKGGRPEQGEHVHANPAP